MVLGRASRDVSLQADNESGESEAVSARLTLTGCGALHVNPVKSDCVLGPPQAEGKKKKAHLEKDGKIMMCRL